MKSPHPWLAVLAGAALAAAPVGLAGAKPHAARKGPAIYTVTLGQMAFGPTPPAIRVGDTI